MMILGIMMYVVAGWFVWTKIVEYMHTRQINAADAELNLNEDN